MILCGGDQVLFGLYSVAIICLLIGGCLWGQGTDKKDRPKQLGGLILFIIGGAFAILAVVVNIIKGVRKRVKDQKILMRSKIIENVKTPNKFENMQQNSLSALRDDDHIYQIQNKPSNHVIQKNPLVFNNLQPNEFKTNYTNKPNGPAILGPTDMNLPYRNNARSQAFYENPVFQPDIISPKQISISGQYAQIQRKNAAKNYSISLYNARAAGKL